ncbi:hypothetical protein TcYC6_0027710 [Trypanosoma cruzi]|nr:hypothetical protein TcYC6_0027710 [Trypanosoma cruzi]
MLNRHGTRLDIGTPEDVAELDAVEMALRQEDGISFGGSGLLTERVLNYEHQQQQRQQQQQQQQHYYGRRSQQQQRPRRGNGASSQFSPSY